jgi:hypothetical protein
MRNVKKVWTVAAGGKRRALRSSLHNATPRAALVLLLACVSAAAAVLGAPLLALVVGFVAVVLLIDYAFPVTGFLRADSQHAFQRSVWQRRREALRKRTPGRLELLPTRLEETARRRHLGIRPIALDSVIGTLEPQKAVVFDHAFRPPGWSRGRWELLWIARRRGDSLPPISVYRLHGRHFVIDGHHRISVECSLNATSIDADIIELLPLSPDPGEPHHHPRSQPRQPVVDPAGAVQPHRHGRGVSPSATGRRTQSLRGWAALLVYLAVGLALTLLSGAFAPAAGYFLIIGACAFIGRGLGSPVHTGFKDYRQ